MMKSYSLALTLALSITKSNGFVPQLRSQNLLLNEQTCCQAHSNHDIQEESSSSPSRRQWISSQIQSLLVVGGVSGLLFQSSPAFAVMSVDQKVFTPGGSLSVPDSKERFVQARKDVQYLLDNYDSISKEGGDAVRRYLGTVGVNGAMYGISKVVKTLREEAEDIVEYTEAMDEFNAYLYQAEGAAYQSIFAEHSSAKATPESCLATAKQDVVMMAKFMDQLQAQLSL
mmetsp:Transcript_18719/g.46326  ORF Transcript_18719/g.46326 Transcript_18719/m.46326 type:complete len:228 (+) Transcript_18719:69-752(+)